VLGREIIMRTSWLIKAQYKWAHHVSFAKAAGFTEKDILRIRKGPKEKGWNREHQAVLQTADDLWQETFIQNATWHVLTEYYITHQQLEIIFTVGGYTMNGLAINNFGIQVKAGYPGFPV
jgi:hypothetical protein